MVDMPPIEEELNACTMCGYCVPICPPYQEILLEDATPRGKVFFMKEDHGRSVLDRIMRRPIKIDQEFVRAVYECTSCGECEEVCMVDIPFTRLWDQVKAWIVEKGVAPMAEHRYLAENVAKEHNILGEPHSRRGDWITGADVKQAEWPDVVLWVGCMQSYRQRQVAAAAVKILNAAGVKYRILGAEEWCSGSPLVRVGYARIVEDELMPHNISAVAGTGAKAMVTACAECYRTFVRDYRDFGGVPPFAVYHMAEYVSKLVSEKRLKFSKKIEKKVAYHDPCHLGRHCNCYDAPRDVMKFIQGLQRLEIDPNRNQAQCSGGAGGFPEAFPQQANTLAARRLEQAAKTGADLMVTACPFARERFDNAAKRQGGGLVTMDIVELLADAL